MAPKKPSHHATPALSQKPPRLLPPHPKTTTFSKYRKPKINPSTVAAFKSLRASILCGPAPTPFTAPIPWNHPKMFEKNFRTGWQVFSPTRKFIQETNLTKFGNEIITRATSLWGKIYGNCKSLTINLSLFYLENPSSLGSLLMSSDPTISATCINHFTRMLLNHAYDNLSRYPFLFLEFYEIQASIQTPFHST